MRVLCENRHCRWVGEQSELLTAPSPFDAGETLTACPKCKDVCSLALVCDEPGCNLPVTCGTPTPTGYRSTCHWHMPKERKY